MTKSQTPRTLKEAMQIIIEKNEQIICKNDELIKTGAKLLAFQTELTALQARTIEECAKVCDRYVDRTPRAQAFEQVTTIPANKMARDCAASIRALNESAPVTNEGPTSVITPVSNAGQTATDADGWIECRNSDIEIQTAHGNVYKAYMIRAYRVIKEK